MSEKIIVEKSKITALADSVRENTGKTETLTLKEIANIVSTLKDYSYYLLTNTLDSYANDDITALKDYAFYKNTTLNKVILPKLTTLGAYALAYTSVYDFDLLDLTSVGEGALAYSKQEGEAEVKEGYGRGVFKGTRITSLDHNSGQAFYAQYEITGCKQIESVKIRNIQYASNTYSATDLSMCTALKKVWISKEAATKNYYGSTGSGLFFGAPTALEFYVEADSMTGSGWKDSSEWTLLQTDTYGTVHYGVTEEEFDNL